MNYSQHLYKSASKIEVLGESLIFKTLSNGLKVLYKKVPHSHVAHCGILINAGSRDDADFMGTAHCMEHMLFKGTKKRKSFHVLNRIDSVGGEINAYTTKETTVLYSSVYEVFLDRAVELLFDIVYNSSFPEKELYKEKRVIKDEIKMYEDSPDDNIFDEFQEMIYSGHPLANNILGTEKSLDRIDSNTLQDFTSTFYKPENMVFVVVSDLPHDKIFKKIEKYALQTPMSTNNLSNFNTERVKASEDITISSQIKKTDYVQSYVIIGGSASMSSSSERLKESLLINVLGGPALNSRLSLGIREKYGFTYNIEAGTTHFTDSGFFHCFAGTDNVHHKKTIDLIKKEFDKLKQEKLGTIQMHNAIHQFTGQIMLAEEAKLSSVIAMGRQWVQDESVLTLKEILDIVNQITASQLLETANRLFDNDKLSLLSYVPSEV